MGSISMKTRDLITISVSIIVIVIIIAYIGPEELFEKFKLISLEVLFLLVILYSLDVGVRVVRLHILASSLGYKVSWTPLFHAQASALFLNTCTPARAGELIRLHVLREEYGINYAEGLAAIVVEHVLNIIAILTIAAVSFLYVKEEYPMDRNIETFLFFGVLLVAILNVFLILMSIWGDRLAPLFRLFGPFQEKLLNFYLSFQQGLTALRKAGIVKLLACVVLSFLVWILEAAMIYFLAKDLSGNSDITFVLATLASVIGNLTFIFPVLPGSLGTYELAIAVIFELVKLDVKTGVLIAAADHAFKTLFLLIVGGYSSAKLGINLAFREEISQKRKLEQKMIAKEKNIFGPPIPSPSEESEALRRRMNPL